ncbi:MAG: NAD(P)-dependent oxidoreductase [Acidobacteria bacterium]|nr:NAD(P)-dependent oxidoreductase [Acidobacteriota bacterium]
MKERIYIAGAGGMLGEAFHKVFGSDFELKCTDIDVNAPWLEYLDFRDRQAYIADVTGFDPQYLFHLGAYTDLEFCEKNVDATYLTNTISVENAVFIANQLEIPLLYISTAGIFDGKHEEYDDWDQPNPLGHYARSKFMGEQYVVAHAHRYLVCRAGWMMGGGKEKDKKFINKLILQLLSGKKEIHVVNDKDGTPTFTVDFAKNVLLLLRSQCWGLYNMVCKGTTSRLEVAKELVRVLDLADKVAIREVSSDYFKDVYSAPRPPSERLLNKKLELRGLNCMQDWKTALREYIDSYYPGIKSELAQLS